MLSRPPSPAAQRILLFCYRRSATQEIHFRRPLRSALESNEASLAVVDEEELSRVAHAGLTPWLEKVWACFRPTLVVFSRYAGPHSDELLRWAEKQGIPIVAHLDDDLFNVPKAIGEEKFGFHSAPERVASLKAVFSRADLIYVPTQPLAEQFRQYGFPAPIIIPPIQVSACHDEISLPADERDRFTIGYMGTASHQADLEMIVPAVNGILARHPRVCFETFGTVRLPRDLQVWRARVAHHPSEADYTSFLDRLHRLGWSVGLAPLRPTRFNDFRTYTKWLEYTLAGICVVASDGCVYRDIVGPTAGILAADGDWTNAIERVIADGALRGRCIHSAQAIVRSELESKRLAHSILSLQRLPERTDHPL